MAILDTNDDRSGVDSHPGNQISDRSSASSRCSRHAKKVESPRWGILMTRITIDATKGIPLTIARAILMLVTVEPDDPRTRAALRPIFHYPRLTNEPTVKNIKGDLRLPTTRRAIRNFSFAGRLLKRAGIESISATVTGEIGPADASFLHTVSRIVPITVHLRNNQEACLRPTDAMADDSESARVLRDVDTILSIPPEDRSLPWCRTLGRYLGSGDPWTATWVAAQAMGRGAVPDAEVSMMIASAYMFSEQPHNARDFCLRAADGSGRIRARALYNLAVLEMRYLPESIRHADRVPGLLDEAWTILSTLPFNEVASEVVLVRNAMALHALRQENAELSCTILQETIEQIVTKGLANTSAHAILLKNLGNAASKIAEPATDELALRSFISATSIDGSSPEYWLELAQFLARRGDFDAAMDAAHAGLRIVELHPELFEVLGYCLSQTDRHIESAEAFLSAVEIGGDTGPLTLASARQFILGGDLRRAGQALESIHEHEVDDEDRAELALLRLESEGSTDITYIEQRLAALAGTFPESDLVQQNLTAVQALHNSRIS